MVILNESVFRVFSFSLFVLDRNQNATFSFYVSIFQLGVAASIPDFKSAKKATGPDFLLPLKDNEVDHLSRLKEQIGFKAFLSLNSRMPTKIKLTFYCLRPSAKDQVIT